MRPQSSLAIRRFGTIGSLMAMTLLMIAIITSLWIFQESRLLAQRQQASDADRAVKTTILSQVRDVTGYDGIIHQFKDVILHRDLSTLSATRVALIGAMEAIGQYERLGVTAEEQEAVKSLHATLATYAAAAGTAEAMIAAGKSNIEFERGAKLDERSALAAFARLADLSNRIRVAGDKVLAMERERIVVVSIYVCVLQSVLLTIAAIGLTWFSRTHWSGWINVPANTQGSEAILTGDTDKGSAMPIPDVASQTAIMRDAATEMVSTMTTISAVVGKMVEMATAISVAVEQQTAAISKIVFNTQATSTATAQMAVAMKHLLEVPDDADDNDFDVPPNDTGTGIEREKSLTKIDQYMLSVPTENDERRRYKRISGNDAPITVRAEGRETQATLRDISRGGAALGCDWTLATGTMVDIDLPHSGGTVTARVIRSNGRETGLVFGGDPANLARVDRTLDSLLSLPVAS